VGHPGDIGGDEAKAVGVTDAEDTEARPVPSPLTAATLKAKVCVDAKL
jgi:hypothetical protein